ncbi:MAG TPA: hypothetical protein VFQ61_04045 [Polyangiaceae bacterium]|nr:hypothetical protein [Polyangiaceae bacterium]
MLKRIPVLVGGLMVSAAMFSGSAQAADQEGLVNVNIEDVTVQIPIAAAANICDLNVLVLAQQLLTGGGVCKAGAITLAQDNDGSGGGATQDGLINVNLSNVDAQVPITIAANICGVAVDVLSTALGSGPVDCNAYGKNAAVSR